MGEPRASAIDPRPVVILGGGGHACVVAEALMLTGRESRGYLAPVESNSKAAALLGSWLGGDSSIPELLGQGFCFAVGIGFVNGSSAKSRAQLLEQIPATALTTVVHPGAIVSTQCTLGQGSFVGPGTIVGTGASLGAAVIANSAAIIEHDCRVDTNAHIASGACLAGGVHCGANVLVGAGAIIRQGLRIGGDAIIGAGAVVLHDVSPGGLVVGNPASDRRDGSVADRGVPLR